MPNLNKVRVIALGQIGAAHLLIPILLLVGIIGGVYLVQKSGYQIFKPKASSTNQSLINEEIYNATLSLNKYILNQEGDVEQLLQVASSRFEKLEKVVFENPAMFLQLASLGNSRDKFPEEIQKYIEKEISIEGQVHALHGDNYESHEPQAFYMLDDKYLLHFTTMPDYDLEIQPKVNLEGVAIGMNLIVEPTGDDFHVLSNDQNDQTIDLLPSDKAEGSKKIGVVLIEFDQPQKEGYNKEEISDYLFGESNSIKDFFLRGSLGKLDFSGDVFGPYLVEGLNFHETCKSELSNLLFLNKYTWLRSKGIIEEKIKKEQGIDLFKEYDKVVFVSKQDYTCPTIGTAFLDQFITLSLGTKGGEEEGRRRVFLTVLGHEMTHTLGIPGHANLLDCYTRTIRYFNSCRKTEYRDYSDTLTLSGYLVFLNAPHKSDLGWIPQDQIETIVGPGIYKVKIWALESKNIPQGDKKVIRIPKNDPLAEFWDIFRGGDLYYYISFRNKEGSYDKGRYFEFTDGASIHLAFDKQFTPSKRNSYLVSAGEDLRSMTLHDGIVFDDRLEKMKITQLEHDEDSVTLEISFYDIQ